MKETSLERIRQEARALGACALIERGETANELLDALFSSQGREFALKHSFPSLNLLREVESELDTRVLVDKGEVEASQMPNILVAGNTEAYISCDTLNKLYHIIVMHGAKAHIELRGHAVATICVVGGEIKVTKASDDAFALIEQ